MTVHLAHFSDVHLTVRPLGWRVRDLFGKRLSGWVNVKFLGRGHRFVFANAVIESLLREFRERPFDHLVFSGDATTMGRSAAAHCAVGDRPCEALRGRRGGER